MCGCVCARVCVCDLGDTHPLYERHITLQMTLLDGDGPFNYSTLMQSAVNTLNQAAEEEAAYPSSLPLSPFLFPSAAPTPSLSLPLSLPLCLSLICFIAVLLCSSHFCFSFNHSLVSLPSATSISKHYMQTLPSL